MRSKILAGLAAVMALLLGAPAMAADKVDLAVYGRLPSVEDMALSPSGKLLAVITTDGEKRTITVQDLVERKLLVKLNAGDSKARSVMWADEDNVLLAVTKTSTIATGGIYGPRGEYGQALLINVPTGEQKQLLAVTREEALNVLAGAPQIRRKNGQTMIYVPGITFVDNRSVVTLFEAPVGQGRTRLIRAGETETVDFLVDEAGDLVAEQLHNPRTGADRVRVRVGGKLKDVALPTAASDSLSLEGFSADGKLVLVNYRDGDRNVYAGIDSAGVARVLPDYDSDDRVLSDNITGRQYGIYRLRGEEAEYRFSDPEDVKAWQMISRAFTGQTVRLWDHSADRKRWIVLADSPTEGPAYFLINLRTGRADILGEVHRGLTPERIAPVKLVKYKAADGTAITGYLTLPKGPAANGLPLIVLPHGGPASRDVPGFDWWAQALAAQGYAVLQPNFRGSSGFGYAHLEAGFGQWGRKMQTDLSDGVRYLAGEGTIDPKRVCIVGASYGGYAALAGPTLDKGVYRCAVSVAGISDVRRMLLDDRQDSTDAYRYWKRFLGVGGVRDPDLAAISPITHLADIDIPILLIHGQDDTVVKFEQSQMMADALKKAGKPYELVTLPGEDHWLSRGATRLRMLESISAFLARNNPAG